MAAPAHRQVQREPATDSTSMPLAFSALENSAASVTISPATTNKNLKFQDTRKNFFESTSLRETFERHPAFKVSSPQSVGNVRGASGREEPNETIFLARIIVALSETSAKADVKRVETTDEAGTERANTFALRPASEGLVSTIMTAYNKHCNLVISPDDVWLTILAQFCAYVNKNAEELRGRIVEHEGKKELVVRGPGGLETADYKGMIRDLLAEIRKNIKSPELADWFRPGFSTTTERDEVCAAATAMASLQAYFEYKMELACGIPSVTLRGTVADWKLLREKVDRLLEFKVQNNPDGSNTMAVWVGYLRKVCDGFVESAEHPESVKTLEFWDKVLSHRGGGSGPSYITGWVSAFTCFDEDGKFIAETTSMRGMGSEFPLVNASDICHNVVSCPVKIDDNGMEYDATLFSGQVVFEAERGEKDAYPTVRPRNDWCMAVAVK